VPENILINSRPNEFGTNNRGGVYLNASLIIPLWISGIAIVAAGREKGGERGLLLSSLAVLTVGAILISLDPGSGMEGYVLLGGAWVGAVLGLLALRKSRIWGAFIFAVLLSVVGFLAAFVSIFRW
jgi:hypothetical protein